MPDGNGVSGWRLNFAECIIGKVRPHACQSPNVVRCSRSTSLVSLAHFTLVCRLRRRFGHSHLPVQRQSRNTDDKLLLH